MPGQSNNYEIATATGTDAQLRVEIPWPFDTKEEIEIWQQNTTTGEVKQFSDGGFAAIVSTDANGPFASVANAWPGEDTTISVARNTPRTREYSVEETEALSGKSLGQAFDRLLKIVQEHDKGGLHKTLTSVNPFTFPAAAVRAGKVLSFDDVGEAVTDSMQANMEKALAVIADELSAPYPGKVPVMVDGALQNISVQTLIREVGLKQYQLPASRVHISQFDNDIHAAKVALEATEITLVIDEPIVLTKDDIIPDTIAIECTRRAFIDGPWTLTVHGDFVAGRHRIIGDPTTVIWNSSVEVFPEWYGVVGNGVYNDTVQMQKAIDATPVDGKLLGRRNSTYYITDQLSIDAKPGTDFDFNRANMHYANTAPSTNGAVCAVLISGSSDVDFRRLHLDILTQSQQYDGIRVQTSEHVRVTRCKVNNARWAGIGVFDETANTSKHITIHRCKVTYCRFGIFSNAYDAKITRNYISDYWSSTQEAIDAGNVWDSSSLYYDGILVDGSGWLIDNNTIEEVGQSGIYTSSGCDGTITNNTLTKSVNKGVDLGVIGTKSASNTIKNIRVSNNTIKDSRTGDIHLKDCDSCTVINNTAAAGDSSHATPVVILNGECLNNTIKYNTLSSVHATTNVVFVNTVDNPKKSQGNELISNVVENPDPAYLINTSALLSNTVSFGTVESIREFKNKLHIDLADKSGFEGKEALRLLPSGDNTEVQVTCETPFRFSNLAGTLQELRMGKCKCDSIENSGLAYFTDSAKLRLPGTEVQTPGYIWYDYTANLLKIWTNTGARTVTIT